MTNLNPEICRELREARRAARLSQSELAAEVGCRQSALSMFEQGQPTKLSGEIVAKLARRFGVSLEKSKTEEAVPRVMAVPQAQHSGYCPNPHCPSNQPYEVAGRRLMRPDRTAADPAGGRYCAVCGEILERRCPNCGSPVHDGAICSHCGEPYIVV